MITYNTSSLVVVSFVKNVIYKFENLYDNSALNHRCSLLLRPKQMQINLNSIPQSIFAGLKDTLQFWVDESHYGYIVSDYYTNPEVLLVNKTTFGVAMFFENQL